MFPSQFTRSFRKGNRHIVTQTISQSPKKKKLFGQCVDPNCILEHEKFCTINVLSCFLRKFSNENCKSKLSYIE